MIADLVSHLENWAEVHPGKSLYTFLNSDGSVRESYTYRSFLERIRGVAVYLAERKLIRCGDPVLIAYPPGLESLVAFFACLHVGAIPVPVPPPEPGATVPGGIERLTFVQRDSGATTGLTSGRTLDHVVCQIASATNDNGADKTLWPNLEWIATDMICPSCQKLPRQHQPILFLQYTSGSTRRPRGVIVTHENVLHNCHGTIDIPFHGVSWLPQFHDMGLIGACLFPLITGGSAVLFSPLDFLRRPVLWFEAIGRYQATITIAPNFGYEYCLRKEKIADAVLASLDLNSIRQMLFGAEPVRSDTFERFRDRFALCGLRRESLSVAYGLAENTLTVSSRGRVALTLDRRLLQRNRLRIDLTGQRRRDHTCLISTGRPLSGVDVRIVDPEERRDVGEDAIGEIWVRGGSKTAGYWKHDELTQEVFHATLTDVEPRLDYLRTGDLGFLHEGELYVCGRLKDMIIVRGRNIYPQDIEAAAEQACPAVRPGSTVCIAIENEHGDECVVLLIEARSSRPFSDLASLVREIRRRCLVDVNTVAVVQSRSLARTSSGKLARSECRRRWQAGEMVVLSQHLQAADSMSHEVLGYLFHDFEWEGADEQTLAELGVDSLTLVSISLDIRKYLDAMDFRNTAAFSDLTMLQAFTLRELRQMIQEALQMGASWNPDVSAISARLRSVEASEKKQMCRNAVLPDDVVPQSMASPPQTGTVLLTGATGFLGSFLLEALLRLSQLQIVTVVRAEDSAHARARVEAALRRTGLWNEHLQSEAKTRVTAIPGDLAKPQLGLADSQWARLRDELAGIYHCGAEVDYIRPYISLRDANVASTVELLRLACAGAAKHFHLISSTFIFGWSGPKVLRECDCNSDMTGLNFGYTQSKWVAEQLVLKAADRGLPASIYRPSLITASNIARYSRSDIAARTLAYMMRHGIATDCTNQVSFLPVDVVANNLIALSLPALRKSATYHMTADNYYNMPDVTSIISRDFGYEFLNVSLEEFVRHMNEHCRDDEPLFPLIPFFNKNYRLIEHMRDKRYDNEHYRLEQSRSAICLPEPPLCETVGAIVKFLQHEALVPLPRRLSQIDA